MIAKRLFKRIILKLLFPKSETNLEVQFIKEAYRFWHLTSQYNASHHTDTDIEKMQYILLRENHIIEKGMSMKNPKLGFGQEKVKKLLGRLNKYYDLYIQEDQGFIRYPLSTILTYITYTENQGISIPIIKREFQELVKKVGDSGIKIQAGVKEVCKSDILNSCNTNFKSLLSSRHSLRYFSGDPISRATIEEALRMAQLTPSACNRQGWKTHVYVGEDSVRLAKWQGGCHGFEDEMIYSILVTSNLKAFLSYEVHQAYIDGGLYAMNLINSLHSLGLGTIPLSCGFYEGKLRELSQFNIPENEVPIVIVAFGQLANQFKVAISSRKDISKTNIFHSNL